MKQYPENLEKEIKEICSFYNNDIEELNWPYISYHHQTLSEDFIREFQDKVYWNFISEYQTLSEEFIREFQDKIVDWKYISQYQKLSEDFIREFQDKVSWKYISQYQKLSENFIKEFKDKVDWCNISYCQKLSENFIREFQDKVEWFYISKYQNLSEDFVKENFKKLGYKTLPNKKLLPKSIRIQQMKEYAKKYNLGFKDNCLYAYRKHTEDNKGTDKFIIYNKVNRIYSDWKCDVDENEKFSYGIGVFSKGNVRVKVHVDWFGVWVKDTDELRVFKFKLLSLPICKTFIHCL